MESVVLELLQKQGESIANIETLLSTSKTVLNMDEVAGLTGLSKSTLYKMTSTGIIPHYKQAKHLFFDRNEVLNWLKSNRIKTKEEIDREAISYVTTKKGRA
jgi:excisionase family DNA binding protein